MWFRIWRKYKWIYKCKLKKTFIILKKNIFIKRGNRLEKEWSQWLENYCNKYEIEGNLLKKDYYQINYQMIMIGLINYLNSLHVLLQKNK